VKKLNDRKRKTVNKCKLTCKMWYLTWWI